MKARNMLIQFCLFGRHQRSRHKTFLPWLSLLLGSLVLSGNTALAQSFSSGSNGSDGALNFATPGIIDFNPRTNVPPLDVDGDNVFHFTTINIGAGVTVRLTGQVFNGPVVWLASGAVTINGTLDLRGENGQANTYLVNLRRPSVPGAGGYSGGVGGRVTDPPTMPAQPGSGPGGGAEGVLPTGNAGIGTFTGNQFLVPLVGGSGGGGGALNSTGQSTDSFGGGGGAGGGAILIASSVSIDGNASINARGGLGGAGQLVSSCQSFLGGGGGGSGGSVRLVAPVLNLLGTIDVGPAPVGCGQQRTGDGRIRLEAFQFQSIGVLSGPFTTSSPSNVFLSTAPPSVRVSSVGGVPVPPNPTGSFQVPDTTITSSAAVTVSVEARNIPLGTILKLYFFSENGPDITTDSTALQGTIALSTATAQVTFPVGFSRGFVRATWTQ